MNSTTLNHRGTPYGPSLAHTLIIAHNFSSHRISYLSSCVIRLQKIKNKQSENLLFRLHL